MEKILQQQAAQVIEQTKHLREIEKHAATDKLVQAAQAYTAYKSLKDSDKLVQEIAELGQQTKKGLLDKTGDGLNANVLKLIKQISISAKGQDASVKQIKKAVDKYDPALRDRSVKAGGQYNATFKEGLKNILGEFKKLGTLEGWVDTSEGKNKGLAGQALMRKINENQFVKDQMKVNPQAIYLNSGHTKEELDADPKLKAEVLKKREADLRAQYNRSQDIARQQRDNEAEISRLTSIGYDEKGLARTGLLKQRVELDEQQAEANPAYRAARKREMESESESQPSKAVAIAEPVSSGGVDVNPEQQAENVRLMNDQTSAIEEIAANTSPIGDILAFLQGSGAKQDKGQQNQRSDAQQGEGEPTGASDLLDLIPSRKTIGKGGAILRKAGKGILGAGKSILGKSPRLATGIQAAKATAIPAAIAYGAANLIDWGAGKLGLGKNEQRQDVVINTAQDDANWEKMSFLEKTESGLARGIEKAGSFVGLDNIARAAQAKRVEAETAYFAEKAVPPAPQSADLVTNTSAANAAAKEQPAAPAPVVINAPQNTSVQQTQNYAPRAPARNTESSYQQYSKSRFAY